MFIELQTFKYYRSGLYPGCGLGAATPPAPAPGVTQCYTGNCTTFADCRRVELVQDCPDPYDACITEIVQKGDILTFTRHASDV